MKKAHWGVVGLATFSGGQQFLRRRLLVNTESVAGGGEKVIFEGLEDAQFQQEQNERGVKERNTDVAEEVATRVLPFLVRKHFLRSFVHEDKAQNVGEPITEDHAGLKRRRVEEADEPGKNQGQRNVDKQVVPPGQR